MAYVSASSHHVGAVEGEEAVRGRIAAQRARAERLVPIRTEAGARSRPLAHPVGCAPGTIRGAAVERGCFHPRGNRGNPHCPHGNSPVFHTARLGDTWGMRDRQRDRRERRDAAVGIGDRRDIPVEVQGRWFLLVELPGEFNATPEDLAPRLLVDRVQSLARALERAEHERDALTAASARHRAANGAAQPMSALRSSASAAIARSCKVPATLRARQRAHVPGRVRWPAWRR